MLEFIQNFAEEQIQKAMREGKFENLEGAGQPLPPDDMSMVPPELRMAYKILKNADCLPPEVQEHKDIQTALELLESMEDEQERFRQIQKLNTMVMRLNMRRKRPVNFETDQIYYQKIVEKVQVNAIKKTSSGTKS